MTLSEELVYFSTPSALGIVQRAVTTALAAALDTYFFDAVAASSARPASILNGLTGLTPAGNLAANVAQTLAAISGGAATSPVVVVSQANSVRFAAFLRDLSTVRIKVLTTPAVGAKIVALDADGIAITNGAVALAVGSPDLEMSDSPTSTPSASTIMTSTWQRNLKSVRAEHLVGWAQGALMRRRS